MSESQHPVELSVDEEDLAARLIAAGVNIESDARIRDGLDERPLDSICELTEADREICALSSRTKERGPPVINKGNFGEALGHPRP